MGEPLAADEGGEPAGGGDAAATPVADDGPRYVELDALGVGGMGEVALVRDRRLGRELAYKRPATPGDRRAAARLAREARITASLDHPGIVTVFDTGVGADGEPFYTMRAVRGRSLARRLAEPLTAADRRALLRHVVAACDAMAYAHRQGVVHRDLTPANVMIGDYGETQLIDWGLALARGEPVAEPRAGTRAYFGPERRRGTADGSDPTSDVWALGAILHEVVTGRRPDGAPAKAVPPELAAILAMALADAPAARYADAGPLADDLHRYLDGRPVGAYAYSSLELARRALRAWRWPLAALATALVVGGVVAIAGWRRTEAQRTRALGAERATRSALAEAQAALGRALASRAVRALEDGAVPEAELLAAHALLAAESADARGVLAATRAMNAPGAVVHHRLPACTTVLDANEALALCIEADGLALWELSPPRRRWHHPGVPHDAVLGPAGTVMITTHGASATALDQETGALRYRFGGASRWPRIAIDLPGARVAALSNVNFVVHDAVDGALLAEHAACIDDRVEQVAMVADTLAVVCRSGEVSSGPVGGPLLARGRVRWRDADDVAAAAALAPDGRLAVGSARGLLQVATLVPWSLSPLEQVRDDQISALTWIGDQLVVRGDRGGAQLWALDGRGERLRLPVRGQRRVQVAGDRLLAIGEGVWQWQVAAATGDRGWRGISGLSTVTVAADGAVAVGRSDGRVQLLSAAGAPVVTLPAVAGLVGIKQVSFVAGGDELAIANTAAPGVIRVDRAGQRRPSSAAPTGAARLVVTRDGAITSLHYGGHRTHWRDGVQEDASGPEVMDAIADVTGQRALVLAADGTIAELDGVRWTTRARRGGAQSLAELGDGRFAVGLVGQLDVFTADAHLATLPLDGAIALDLAVSPDRRWLAAACTDGAIRVWDTTGFVAVATLRGHTQRVAAVVFDGRGALWSASWDGRVRAWDVTAFAVAPRVLVDEAAARWAMSLADAP